MEAEELAECNLTSPRTGTPVKLLGREDASVDWYNLEKSKRVKAFRCGEFDDCIERAESAQGMPIKKREKYARREDAILHALELEKQLLGRQGKLGVTSDHHRTKPSGSAKKEPDTFSDGLGNNSGKLGNAKLDQSSRRVVDADNKDEIPVSLVIPVKAQDGNQPIWEEDLCEATPRMRGLQDFGLRTAPLKRKLSSSVDLDSSVKPMTDNHSQDLPSGTPCMERTTLANGVEQMGTIGRAKRNRCVFLPAESSDSMDDKELPLSQIKMSPTQVEDMDFHTHSGSLNEDNSSSGFMEDVESDSSESDSSESESDSSETEPDMDKAMPIFSDAVPAEAEQDDAGPLGAPELGCTSCEESDGSAFSGDMCHLYPDDPFLANETVSKWQLKGKRNIRHLTRSVGRDYGNGSNGLHAAYHRMKGGTLGQRTYGVDDTNLEKKYARAKITGLDNGGYSYMSKFASKARNDSNCNTTGWEDQSVYRGRWEDRGEHFNPIFFGRHLFGGRARSMLVDVDLKVQASYQKERVPIVSLMSKLNGQAIIGHPIQVETLHDGSSKTLIPTNDYISSEAFDRNGNTALQPAWRTARRTNLRVPRPHLTSLLGGEDGGEDTLCIGQERRLPYKKSSAGTSNHKASLVRKSFPHIPWPPTERKFPRKLPKKVSIPSYQKTRTLSSIGIQQTYGTKPKHDYSKIKLDGLKPDTSGLTTVACIPVKLVFSRLLEKINRPPSKAATKVVVSIRDEDRQSS